MKWSEFKKLVDDTIGPDTDPEITYIDVDDFSIGRIGITNWAGGLIIVENAPKLDRTLVTPTSTSQA